MKPTFIEREGVNMNGFEYCRKRAGLTQTEVAKEMNVTQGTVCAWETGRTYPTGEKVPALARLYGCRIDDLYAGAGSQQASKQTLEASEMREFARKYGLDN
jgi:transcriptional regulator with XRE-family HTH domain